MSIIDYMNFIFAVILTVLALGGIGLLLLLMSLVISEFTDEKGKTQ